MPSPTAAVLGMLGIGAFLILLALGLNALIGKLRLEIVRKEKRPKMNKNFKRDEEGSAPIGLIVIVVGVLAVFGIGFYVVGLNNVDAGQRAVVFHSNGDLTTLNPGMYQWENPWSTDVYKYNVQTKVEHAKASAASKDLQEVKVEVTVQFHPDPSQITWIHQNIGGDYVGKVIVPAVQEAVKASTAKHDAANIIQNRPVLKDEIESVLRVRLEASHILVDQVSLTNIDFSAQFNTAIENSQTAKQNIILEQNQLEVIKLRATQKIEEAKGQAEAARIVSEAVSQNQDYIPYLYAKAFADHWNGVLPIGSSGGVIPFLNVGSAGGQGGNPFLG